MDTSDWIALAALVVSLGLGGPSLWLSLRSARSAA